MRGNVAPTQSVLTHVSQGSSPAATCHDTTPHGTRPRRQHTHNRPVAPRADITWSRADRQVSSRVWSWSLEGAPRTPGDGVCRETGAGRGPSLLISPRPLGLCPGMGHSAPRGTVRTGSGRGLPLAILAAPTVFLAHAYFFQTTRGSISDLEGGPGLILKPLHLPPRTWLGFWLSQEPGQVKGNKFLPLSHLQLMLMHLPLLQVN